MAATYFPSYLYGFSVSCFSENFSEYTWLNARSNLLSNNVKYLLKLKNCKKNYLMSFLQQGKVTCCAN